MDHNLANRGVLLVHAINVRGAGSRTIVRMSLSDWCAEADVCAVLQWGLLVLTKCFCLLF